MEQVWFHTCSAFSESRPFSALLFVWAFRPDFHCCHNAMELTYYRSFFMSFFRVLRLFMALQNVFLLFIMMEETLGSKK